MAGAVKGKYRAQLREKLIKAGKLGETGDGSAMERVYNKKLNKVSTFQTRFSGKKNAIVANATEFNSILTGRSSVEPYE